MNKKNAGILLRNGYYDKYLCFTCPGVLEQEVK